MKLHFPTCIILLALPLAMACGDANDEVVAPGDEPGAVGGKADIYGDDDRYEYYDFADHPTVGPAARAAAVMLTRSNIMDSGIEGFARLPGETQTSVYQDHCPDERFLDQPNPGRCSGFLVGPDLLVTAGHCISSSTCRSNSFAFGFAYETPNDDVTLIPEADIYDCKRILAWEYDDSWLLEDEISPDYALVQLSRPVLDRKPLDIRRSGHPAVGTPLFAVTHAIGLPLKIGMNGVVAYNGPANYFVDSTDSFGGSSGGAVINYETGRVEGIVSRGPQDFAEQEDACWGTVRCDEVDITREDRFCTGNESTLVTTIASFIPPADDHPNWQRTSLVFTEEETDFGQIFAAEVEINSPGTMEFGWIEVPEDVDFSSVYQVLVYPPDGSRGYVGEANSGEGLFEGRYLLRPAEFESRPEESIALNGTWRVELFGNPIHASAIEAVDLRLIADIAHPEEPTRYTQSFENFKNDARTYQTGRFIGDRHVAWEFEEVRNTVEAGFEIDGQGIILRGRSRSEANPYQARIVSQRVAGGIASFSVDLRKAFAAIGVRQVELVINGEAVARSEAFGNFSGDDDTVHTFAVDGIDISGTVTIELRALGAGQVTIDNLSWTTYSPE
ncbi:MAG: trypsin-like serine peptidase [Bradymonadaceae bacterium]